ncbi:MAG: ribosome silencing factor [Pseudomonadota bacterium]
MKKLPPLIKLAIEAVEELKASDVKLIDVSKLTPVTDYMLVCTGTSNRHVKSIAENVALRAKHAGHPPRAVEGGSQSEWVLVDLGDVIVHAMQTQARAHYQLEKLWDMQSEAPKTSTEKSKKKFVTPKKKAAKKKIEKKTKKKNKKKR